MQFKKKIMSWMAVGLLVCLVISLIAVACAAPSPSPSPSPTPPPAADTYNWKLQHTWGAAEGSVFVEFANSVRDMSGGRINIEVFADGELVPFEDAPEATKMGLLDMFQTHPKFISDDIPEGLIESLPFLWKDVDEEMAVLYELGLEDIYREAFEEKLGVKFIGIGLNDSDCMVWTEPFESLADLKGRKASIFPPISNVMTRAGITAEFIDPGDLYVSLATGVLDGLAWGNARAYYELGFFEVAPYFQMPSMCPSAFSTFSMNQKLWDQLTPDLQSILVNATRVNGTHMRSTLKAADGELLLKAIDEWDVKVVTFSDEDVAQLSTWAMEFLDEISQMSPRCKEATDIVYHALDIFEAHR